MKNWIEPIIKTIKKYKALKKFIKTGEFNEILTSWCAFCEEAVKKDPKVHKCYNCIYNQLFDRQWCMQSKDFQIVYNLDADFFWNFGDLINSQDYISIAFNLNEILKFITKEELLKKLKSRINFLNNMLSEVKR